MKYPREVDEESVVGKDSPSYTPSEIKDKVVLLFKQNRSYELKIGTEYYFFAPSSRMEVPASIINHPDFESQRKFFEILN